MISRPGLQRPLLIVWYCGRSVLGVVVLGGVVVKFVWYCPVKFVPTCAHTMREADILEDGPGQHGGWMRDASAE